MIYFIVILICLACVVMYDSRRLVLGRDFFFYFLLLCAILVAGLRNGLGGDTIRYMEHFEAYPLLSEINSGTFFGVKFEPLWLLTNILLKSLSFDFYDFQIVHAIFVNSVVFLFFKRYSAFPFLTIFIYFIIFYLYLNMEILREAVAIAFFLLSFKYLRNRMWWKYSFYILVASLFHASALLLFCIPFFINHKITIRNILRYLIISFVGVQLFSFLIYNFIGDTNMIGRSLVYIELFNWESAFKSLFFFYIIPLFIYLYLSKKCKISEIHSKLDILIMPYFFIASLTIASPGIAGRLMNYMMPAVLIYTTYIFVYSLKVKFNVVLLVLLILPCTRMFNYYFIDTSYVLKDTKRYFMWYPYRTYITKDNKYDRNLFNLRSYYSHTKMSLDKNK